MVISESFYLREDTLAIAKELLGKYVFTNIDGTITGGMIVETEAYMGVTDASCHTFNNRKSVKNATMYDQGGVAYMYICYGIHDMLNLVTGPMGKSHVVLIRAIEPTDGIEKMIERRGNFPIKKLTNGPGSLAKALGLNKSFDKESLNSERLWLEDRGLILEESNIKITPRIGINCPEPFLTAPWRFLISGNTFVSRK